MKPRRVRKPFRPTRRCPHRMCVPLHRWIMGAGTVILIASFVVNPIAEAVILIFSVIVGAAIMSSKWGGDVDGRVAHETAGAGGSAHTEVSVDMRWARIAVAMDTIMSLGAVFVLVAVGLAGTAAFKQDNTLPPDLGWSMIVSAVFYTFDYYAHWRATRPRPKRRVRVWLGNLIPALAPGR